MSSNVGSSSVYEAGDQRTSKEGSDAPERFEEGKKHSHEPNDPKDERSIANRLANEEKKEQQKEGEKNKETEQLKKDATLPARSHGNEPSKGAKIDQELKEEEEELLKKKGSFGPKASN